MHTDVQAGLEPLTVIYAFHVILAWGWGTKPTMRLHFAPAALHHHSSISAARADAGLGAARLSKRITQVLNGDRGATPCSSNAGTGTGTNHINGTTPPSNIGTWK